MSFRVHRSAGARHLVFRAGPGELLPDGLVGALRAEGVSSGWLRANGVLRDVKLVQHTSADSLDGSRELPGVLQALLVEGAVQIGPETTSLALRALLTRDREAGIETFAGEIAFARTVEFEAWVTAFEGVEHKSRAIPAHGWSSAVAASSDMPMTVSPRPSVAQGSSSAHRMPPRPNRRRLDLDSLVPEAGDRVDHFAFGPCEVVKGDGDRLRLKVRKDGRIREIALEMLRVTRVEGVEGSDDGRARFKLERRT